MAELVDASDLRSDSVKEYGFESHLTDLRSKQMVKLPSVVREGEWPCRFESYLRNIFSGYSRTGIGSRLRSYAEKSA